MNSRQFTIMLAGIGLSAFMVSSLPLQAQRIAVRAGTSPGKVGTTETNRQAVGDDALSARVPSQGFVQLDGSMYQIEGVPGGARLSSVFVSPSRAGASGFLFAGSDGRWVRSAKGSANVAISGERGTFSVDAGMPVEMLALSSGGDVLAVGGDRGQSTRLFNLAAPESAELATIDWQAEGLSLTSLSVADDASVVLSVFERDGLREARVWERSSNSHSLLGQGESLRVALTAPGTRLAMWNPGAKEFSIFERGSGGFALRNSRVLPSTSPFGESGIQELAQRGSAFLLVEVRGRDVVVCGESGDCLYTELPIPEVRSVRDLRREGLLFVESSRGGVPSYLLELGGSDARWHFVGRADTPSREAPDRRPRVGRVGRSEIE